MIIARRNLFILLIFLQLSLVSFCLFFRLPDDLSSHMILKLRFIEVCNAFLTGGLLALAGALLQVLLRNPLADPYILGVSSGGALGMIAALSLGLENFVGTFVWLGCLAVIFSIYFLARHKSYTQFLLLGIAVAGLCTACISLFLSLGTDTMMRSWFFWFIGDLTYSQHLWHPLLALSLGLLVSCFYARDLNVLLQGETVAALLGVNTQTLQRNLYFLSALLTAVAVINAGCIGFVGLLVPHIFRLLFGSDHRWLLPGSVLMGGTVLMLADLLAKQIFFPQLLPVGIVMSLIGTPIFIFLLVKKTYA